VFGLEKAYGDDAMRRAATFEWWSSEARNFEAIKKEVKTACSTILLKPAANGLRYVFEKWVERCKKRIACQGRYLEKRPSPHLHKVQTRNNKASPRTFQIALVYVYMCVCVCILKYSVPQETFQTLELLSISSNRPELKY
jgi:hypothetical protein